MSSSMSFLYNLQKTKIHLYKYLSLSRTSISSNFTIITSFHPLKELKFYKYDGPWLLQYNNQGTLQITILIIFSLEGIETVSQIHNYFVRSIYRYMYNRTKNLQYSFYNKFTASDYIHYISSICCMCAASKCPKM